MALISLGDAAPLVALLLVAAVFIAFLLELRPAEVTALSGAIAALLLGLVTVEDFLAAIANPAPATIGAMFVLSAALVRTGALDAAVTRMSGLADRRPVLALVVFFGAAAASSAVMNNTPVVMVLIPMAMGLAQQTGIASSRLLIPLSYMVILGGTVSMIGTSTNLLVDGVARDLGMAPFGLFEIAPLGLVVCAVGGGFMALFGRHLLPDRGPGVSGLAPAGKAWLAELFIPPGSSMIGRPVSALDALHRGRGKVIDVVRGDISLRHTLAEVVLEAGDRIVLRTRDIELMGFRDGTAQDVTVPGIEAAQARRSAVVEVLVGPDSEAIGHSLRALHWRRRFGVYAIALHRKGGQMQRLEDEPLQVGDMLLLDGAAPDIARLAEETGLTLLTPSPARAFRHHRAPVALAILAGVVGLAAFNIAPILPLALTGVALVFLTGCLDTDEGLDAIDGRLMLLIVSMLVLGTAIDRTGALTLLVGWLSPVFAATGPWLALALVYAITSILTEMVTNNAVAVLMTPIAAGLATSLGLDPRPFVIAVMVGASASFATPIGYQTNTLVYNAGGYRFTDFLRIGVPMNLLIGLTTVLVVPLMWPLTAG